MDDRHLLKALQRSLAVRASAKTKAWWEAYLKGAVPFRGVKMADVRAALHAWRREEDVAQCLSRDEELALALLFFEEEHCEDKLAGILYLQEILIPEGTVRWRRDLPRLARLFDDGHIADWNTCDWFCVKVLGPLAHREGERCARAIAGWRNAPGLWRRRAAGVAFVNLAKDGDQRFDGFVDLLLEVCDATVRSDERFAQTGTGWVLRELSAAEPSRVVGFVEERLHRFSAEGLRYATEKMPGDVRKRLRQARRKT